MNDNILQRPEISIVFTSYNHKEYLKQSLDALLNQTFTNYELIIVDDCSTDGSQEILKYYARIDKRIRLYLNDKNSGSYVTSTNYGASLSVAPYIIFAQCDDWAELTQLETLYEKICRFNVGVVFSGSNMVDAYGNLLNTDYNYRSKLFRKKCTKDCIITKREAYYYLLDSCIIPNLSAALINKELFDKAGGLSNRYFVLADWDFWLRISQVCDFYYVKTILNNFRQHDASIRSTIKIEKHIEELMLMYSNVLMHSHHDRYQILSCAAKVSMLMIKDNVTWRWVCFKKICKEGACLSRFWLFYIVKAFCVYLFIFMKSKIKI